MKLRAEGFNTNGTGDLRGTLIAIADDGTPLGFEHRGNFSNMAERNRLVAGLVSETGAAEDTARAIVTQALKAIRQAADSAPEDAPPAGIERISARLPGLVDVVAADDGRPVYLFITEAGLHTADHLDADGVRYIPPDLVHFPYKLPLETAIRTAYAQDTDLRLFADLLDWHKTASKLPSEGHYELVALFDLHTWLADLADYSPYLTFESRDPERGKTRAGQAIAWVSYRGIHTETLQEANLFRWSDSLQATLFIDVRDVWRKAEKRGSDDILLARFQRNGARVARVLDPQAGPFKGVTYFDCYGPTVLAVNESLREPLTSRSLCIVPPEASGRYPTMKEEDALPLRARCAAFRARHLLEPLPTVEKPSIGRLGDIMQPLAQVAAIIGGAVETGFPETVEDFQSARRAARSESREAQMVAAVRRALVKDGLVEFLPNSAVAEAFNSGLPEKAQLTEDQIGTRLAGLGFLRARNRKQRGRKLDLELLVALERKFGLTADNDEGTPGQKESQESQLALAQIGDSFIPKESQDGVTLSQGVTPSVTSEVVSGVTPVTPVTPDVQPKKRSCLKRPATARSRSISAPARSSPIARTAAENSGVLPVAAASRAS